MTFKTLIKAGKTLGLYAFMERDFFFFGTKFTDLEQLRLLFPSLRFSVLNQVHKADIVQVNAPSEGLWTADGQWTQEENLALVIKTADCIPLLFRSPSAIAAAHAGWRGVEARIAPKVMKISDFSASSVHAAVGPHIQPLSFEVGKEVAEKLRAADPQNDESVLIPHSDPNKKKVNLAKIVNHQILHINPHTQLTILKEDTFTQGDLYWSYRRDQPQGPPLKGRQLSFIARISSEDFPNWSL